MFYRSFSMFMVNKSGYNSSTIAIHKLSQTMYSYNAVLVHVDPDWLKNVY